MDGVCGLRKCRRERANYLSGNENGDESDSANSSIEENSNLQSNDMFDLEFLTILDRAISIEEIRKVITKLKNSKEAGLNKIIPELLKSFDDNFLSLIVSTLNEIPDSGKFPDEWALGMIVILFKEGTKSDLNNYRGITLLSMLGKILVGVSNNGLWEVVDKYEIHKENQAGFRQGYRTTDHLFTLTTIIDQYAIKQKRPLFLCFVEFRKAFNKVDHKLLWDKINQYGVGGKFLDIIKSMYQKVKSCFRANNGLTNVFSHSRGVRQGCLLSPLLFSLFLNDLVECLEKDCAHGVELWDIT